MPTLTLQQIDVQKIKPSATQARQTFDETALQELAQSMKSEGLIQPITVRPCTVHGAPSTEYELISGERRLRAAKSLGWTSIDAVVQSEVSDRDAAIRGLIENLQRADLNPIERAQGFKRLSDPPFNMTQEEIASLAGLGDHATVARHLALLEMPQEVQDIVTRGTISETHARSIRQIPDKDQQIKLAQQADKEGWSVKETDKRVKQAIGHKPKAAKVPAEPVPDPLAAVWQPLQSKDDFTPDVHWEVKYGPHEIAPGHKVNGWFFFAMPIPGLDPKQALGTWHTQLGKALSDGKVESVMPESIQQMQDVRKSLMDTLQPRLPKTPGEEAELSALAAAGGPKAVYAWIYGAGSPFLQAVPNSWEEAGVTPEVGLQQILAGIKQMQGAPVPA